MHTYIAQSRKEFERVCEMLIALNIKWVHKCSWNIEISLQFGKHTKQHHHRCRKMR